MFLHQLLLPCWCCKVKEEGKTRHSVKDAEGNDLPGSEAALRPVAKHLAFTYTLIMINQDGK